MQHTAIFEEQVALTPKDMRREISSIDTVLLERLRAKLESKCSRHGFVLPDTVRILSRSMGQMEKGRFTGNLLFHVQAEGMVLNPPDGTVIEGEVFRKNKMGMYVNYKDAIRVLVPRDLHIGDEAFDSVGLKEIVKVEIKKSRFQVNDEYILSVGFFRGSLGKVEGAAEGAAEPEAEAEEGEETGETEPEAEAEGEAEGEAEAEAEEELDIPDDLPDLVEDPEAVAAAAAAAAPSAAASSAAARPSAPPANNRRNANRNKGAMAAGTAAAPAAAPPAESPGQEELD